MKTPPIRIRRRWHPDAPPGQYERWPWIWECRVRSCKGESLISRVAACEQAARQTGLAHLTTHKES